MSKVTKRSALIEELYEILKKDWKGKYRKYPDQAIFALEDERVVRAIEKRFEKNGTIKEIRTLNYDFYTGLINIIFEFTPSTGSTGLLSPDALLIIMDSNCYIVGIVDPFDPVQPNRFVPPLPKEGEQPFVLAQPSEVRQVIFSDEELYPVQVRSREFFKKLLAGGSSPNEIRRDDNGEIVIIIHSTTPYLTQTPSGWRTDHTSDDNGELDDPGFSPI